MVIADCLKKVLKIIMFVITSKTKSIYTIKNRIYV